VFTVSYLEVLLLATSSIVWMMNQQVTPCLPVQWVVTLHAAGGTHTVAGADL